MIKTNRLKMTTHAHKKTLYDYPQLRRGSNPVPIQRPDLKIMSPTSLYDLARTYGFEKPIGRPSRQKMEIFILQKRRSDTIDPPIVPRKKQRREPRRGIKRKSDVISDTRKMSPNLQAAIKNMAINMADKQEHREKMKHVLVRVNRLFKMRSYNIQEIVATSMRYTDSLEIVEQEINKKYNAKQYAFKLNRAVEIDAEGATEKEIKNIELGLFTLFDIMLDKLKTRIHVDQTRIKFYFLQRGDDGIVIYPRWLELRDFADYSADYISSAIVNTLASNTFISIRELDCGFHVYEAPEGMGLGSQATKVLGEQDLIAKKSVILIDNSRPTKGGIQINNACAVLALHVVDAYHKKEAGLITKIAYKLTLEGIRVYNKKHLKNALELYDKVHVEKNTPISFEQLTLFEAALNVNIVVIANLNQVAYPLPEKLQDIDLEKPTYYLLWHNNHFNAITNVSQYMGCNADNGESWCHGCQSKKLESGHECAVNINADVCRKCHTNHTNASYLKIVCTGCNISFFSQTCFDRHLAEICAVRRVCTGCNQMIDVNHLHECGKKYCSTCEMNVPLGHHECYVKQNRDKRSRAFLGKVKSLIFYDYETITNEANQHVPVRIHATRDWNGEVTKHSFRTNDEFCSWLFSNQNRGAYALAHNAKGYDVHFIKQYLYKTNLKFHCTDIGLKSIGVSVTDKHITLMDSCAFFMCALKKLPKTFKLNELKKGCWPYRFHKLEHTHFNDTYENMGKVRWNSLNEAGELQVADSVGFSAYYSARCSSALNELHSKIKGVKVEYTHPLLELYDWSNMTKDDQKELVQFLTSVSGQQFNLDIELDAYCASDVDILHRAWLKFRESFMEITRKMAENITAERDFFYPAGKRPFTGIDPTRYLTIASLCLDIYRTLAMPKQSIAQLNEDHVNFSVGGLEWILFLEQQRKIVIDREAHLPGINGTVDGFCSSTNTVYQYNGCFWHGCRKCFGLDFVNNKTQKSMDQLNAEYETRCTTIRNAGYTVETIWECEWSKLKKAHVEIRNLIADNKERLRAPHCSIRDSFCGGRTEVFDLFAEAYTDDQGQEWCIDYADFTSLYPSVQALCKYPIGHPVRLNGADEISKHGEFDIDKYFGFVYCKVQSNPDLRIPVLPEKGEKLTFRHGVLTGVWHTAELDLAIKRGYTVLDVYEIIHFPETSTDLWTSYIKTFFKTKTECDFREKANETPEELHVRKLQIIEMYKNAEVPVELEYDKLEANEPLKFVSKICLNSLWGKFAQRDNQLQTVVFKNDVIGFYKLMFSDVFEAVSECFLDEDTVEVKYKYRKDLIRGTPNTNIAVAATTTAHARTWWYSKLMEKVGPENAIYGDTDSLIYYHKKGQNPIESRAVLGGLTLETEGHTIKKIVAMGPKSYSYIRSDGKVCLKNKGIRASAEAEKVACFENLERIVKTAVANHRSHSLEEEKLTFSTRQFRVDGTSKQIKTMLFDKKTGLHFDKRVIDFENVQAHRITTTPITR